MLCLDLEADLFQPHFEKRRQGMNAFGNYFQTVRTMIDGIHRRNIGQQCLSSTNITRRFITTNMLFASLERHAIGRITIRVDRKTDNTPGHRTLVFIASSEESRMRTTIPHRYTEALAR